MNAPRIAIVGARRVRQGLGPFVARFLARRGAEVCAFLGTSAESIAAATEDLERIAGVTDARGYTDLDALLENEALDALVVLSPSATHGRYLAAALEARLHVLCEKPLLYGEPDLASRARALAEGFDARGLLLRENCQWPLALPAYAELFPETVRAPFEHFGMRLSPASRGAAMIADALPHPLSVLQAHSGAPGSLENPIFSTHDPACEVLEIGFRFVSQQAEVGTQVRLVHGDRLPRDAGLSINGAAARREVDMSDYSMYLASESGPASDSRRVRVPDPLDVRLGIFLD